MTVTPLHATWLPTRDAAAQLGVNRRTLQRWASAGRIESRPGPDGVTLYRVPKNDTAAARDTVPPTAVTRAARVAAPRDTAATSPVGELVHALRDALHSAALAGVQRDAAIAELDQVRAELDDTRRRADLAESTATDLASALRRRAVIVRDLARRVGELQAAVPRHGSTPSR